MIYHESEIPIYIYIINIDTHVKDYVHYKGDLLGIMTLLDDHPARCDTEADQIA